MELVKIQIFKTRTDSSRTQSTLIVTFAKRDAVYKNIDKINTIEICRKHMITNNAFDPDCFPYVSEFVSLSLLEVFRPSSNRISKQLKR